MNRYAIIEVKDEPGRYALMNNDEFRVEATGTRDDLLVMLDRLTRDYGKPTYYDYDLQVWVVDGAVRDCAHPESMRGQSRTCCMSHRLAGMDVAEAHDWVEWITAAKQEGGK